MQARWSSWFTTVMFVALMVTVVVAQSPAENGPAESVPAAAGPSAASPAAAAATAIPNALTLADAERLLTERSLAAASNRYQLDAAKALRLIAGYKPNPTVQVGAEQFPFASPAGSSVPRFASTDQNAAAQPTYTVQFTKVIERGGKREFRIEGADATVQAAEFQILDTLRTQLFQLRQAFAGALVARDNLRLAQTIVEQYDRMEQLTAVKVQAGDLPPVERSRVRAGRLQFAQAVIDAHNAYELSSRDLLNLLNLSAGDAGSPQQVVGDFTDAPVTKSLAELRAMSLDHRPDVQLARRNLIAASRGLDLARAQRTRDVAVTGEYQRVGEDHSVGALMQIPLFISNNQKAGITQADAQRKSTETLVQLAERQAITDVDKAYQAYLSAKQTLELYSTDNLNQVRHLQEVADFTYRQGGTSLFELLEIQRSTQQTLIVYNQARANYQIALWQLEEAVGGPVF
jgi:cobalt-zinc-cadmium efflux system outer membrane protein